VRRVRPPFGLLLYVMKAVAPLEITLRQIYVAAMPFIVLEVIVLAMLVAWPGLATWPPLVVGR